MKDLKDLKDLVNDANRLKDLVDDFSFEYDNITFDQLWNEYKKHIEIRLKYNSIRTIVNRIEQHALPYFKDYILTLPEGFTKKDSYIKNNNLIISYKEYPLSFEDIKNNKELLNNSLEEQGYVINKDDIRKIDDKDGSIFR